MEPCKEQNTLGKYTILRYIVLYCFYILDILTMELANWHITVSWPNSTGEEDLIEITDYLFELDKTDIYNLGLVLGLSQRRVKAMMNSETFLDDMISAWLQRIDLVEKRGVPTWHGLVEALRHRRVGETSIASEIEKDKL